MHQNHLLRGVGEEAWMAKRQLQYLKAPTPKNDDTSFDTDVLTLQITLFIFRLHTDRCDLSAVSNL